MSDGGSPACGAAALGSDACGGEHQLSVCAPAVPVLGSVLQRESGPGHDVPRAGGGRTGAPSPELRTRYQSQVLNNTHYITKSIGTPSNDRFDYFSNFHEYKS